MGISVVGVVYNSNQRGKVLGEIRQIRVRGMRPTRRVVAMVSIVPTMTSPVVLYVVRVGHVLLPGSLFSIGLYFPCFVALTCGIKNVHRFVFRHST